MVLTSLLLKVKTCFSFTPERWIWHFCIAIIVAVNSGIWRFCHEWTSHIPVVSRDIFTAIAILSLLRTIKSQFWRFYRLKNRPWQYYYNVSTTTTIIFRLTLWQSWLIKPVSNLLSMRAYVRTCIRPSVHKTLLWF